MSRIFALLSQDNCPNCERLKAMLRGPLRGQFDDQIEVVHRQEQPERFAELAEAYGVKTAPALLNLQKKTALLVTNGLGEVRTFLTVD